MRNSRNADNSISPRNFGQDWNTINTTRSGYIRNRTMLNESRLSNQRIPQHDFGGSEGSLDKMDNLDHTSLAEYSQSKLGS